MSLVRLARLVAAASIAAAMLASGCAAQQRETRLREQLDAAVIERPLAEVWPAALRLLDERGFPLTGDDPLRIGKPAQGAWARVLSKGRETFVASEGRWVAETGVGRRELRYRVEGLEVGAGAARVVYTAIEVDPAGSPNSDRPSRDLELELLLLRELAPERAARVVEAAGR